MTSYYIRNLDPINIFPDLQILKYTQLQKKLYTLFSGEYSIYVGGPQTGFLKRPIGVLHKMVPGWGKKIQVVQDFW